jgi:hypothetical protein
VTTLIFRCLSQKYAGVQKQGDVSTATAARPRQTRPGLRQATRELINSHVARIKMRPSTHPQNALLMQIESIRNPRKAPAGASDISTS